LVRRSGRIDVVPAVSA